jgi:hypothetical protein
MTSPTPSKDKFCNIEKGVLIKCDIPIKQYILYLNSKASPKFVKQDLDSETLLISPEFVQHVQEQVKEFIETNSRPPVKPGPGRKPKVKG